MEYAIFLRGVNVNGRTIKMKELRQLFVEHGFDEPATILASGNIIVSYDGEEGALLSKVNSMLEEAYHYEAHAIIKSADEVKAICEEGHKHLVDDSVTHYILLTKESGVMEEIEVLFHDSEHTYQEMLVVHETGCYWMVAKGHTLDTPFGKKILGNPKYKALVTSRNMNTLYKVEARMT